MTVVVYHHSTDYHASSSLSKLASSICLQHRSSKAETNLMPHRLDCGLLHHAFRGRRGRSVGDDITRCHSLSECLVCFTLRQLLLLLPVGCRVESLWPLAYWSWQACWLAKAWWGLCGRTRKGGGRGRTAQVAPRTTDDQALALCEADQYLDGSRSFHPCDHGKRNLAQASVTTTRISLSSRQPRLQCKAATIGKSQPQQPF